MGGKLHCKNIATKPYLGGTGDLGFLQNHPHRCRQLEAENYSTLLTAAASEFHQSDYTVVTAGMATAAFFLTAAATESRQSDCMVGGTAGMATAASFLELCVFFFYWTDTLLGCPTKYT